MIHETKNGIVKDLRDVIHIPKNEIVYHSPIVTFKIGEGFYKTSCQCWTDSDPHKTGISISSSSNGTNAIKRHLSQDGKKKLVEVKQKHSTKSGQIKKVSDLKKCYSQFLLLTSTCTKTRGFDAEKRGAFFSIAHRIGFKLREITDATGYHHANILHHIKKDEIRSSEKYNSRFAKRYNQAKEIAMDLLTD